MLVVTGVCAVGGLKGLDAYHLTSEDFIMELGLSQLVFFRPFVEEHRTSHQRNRKNERSQVGRRFLFPVFLST